MRRACLFPRPSLLARSSEPAPGPSGRARHRLAGGGLGAARPWRRLQQRRPLLTLAIESSCDDTCVAIIEKDNASGAASLLFNKKITSDNRNYRGVHPVVAVESHTAALAPMLREAIRTLPPADGGSGAGRGVVWADDGPRRRPDFVSVTRGPGMLSNLATGLNTAKGLAVAWGVPLLAVNHMQAHALTPRLVAALDKGREKPAQSSSSSSSPSADKPAEDYTPGFPFLSLLVSGGHTLLVRSRALCDHEILAHATNIAVGDVLDKCARLVLPPEEIASLETVMYAPLLERFAFPGSEKLSSDGEYDYEYTPPPKRGDEIMPFDAGSYGWSLTPPLAGSPSMVYDFSALYSQVQKVLEARPGIDVAERRVLARATMKLAFEHLASRLLLALKHDRISRREGGGEPEPTTVVVAGGVASNKFLMHILRRMLEVRGFGHLEVVAPPPALCTDNAAMIGWTGIEMFEAGYRSELDVLAIRKWPVDPRAVGGGILGAPGWAKVDV